MYAEKEGVKRSKERRNGERVTKNKTFKNELVVRPSVRDQLYITVFTHLEPTCRSVGSTGCRAP